MVKNKIIIQLIATFIALLFHANNCISERAVALKEKGITYREKKDYNRAIECLISALEDEPIYRDAYLALADVFQKQENDLKAIECLTQGINYFPNDIVFHFNLGFLHTRLGNVHKALAAYQEVLRLSPGNEQALYNCAYVLKMGGYLDQALAIYQEIIDKNPHNENAYFALGRTHLRKGSFSDGWQIHKRYLKRAGKNADKLRELLVNNKIAGKTILLIPEGGLGDTIQFIRYAKKIKDLGAHVLCTVQKPLVPLITRCPYIDQLFTIGDNLPHYDAKSTLMSLAPVFESDEETIPRMIPYLYPDQELTRQWASYFPNNGTFRIGLCWGASVANDVSRAPVARRGISLDKLSKLASIPNCSFYSLQKYDGVEELKNISHDFTLHNFGQDFDESHGPFMDTAAIMTQLDLVITVDTAIAHLAGALGVPVWLMLPYDTDWRWLVDRTDTPWYPTMQIFKQPKPFDWDSVVAEITLQLKKLQ